MTFDGKAREVIAAAVAVDDDPCWVAVTAPPHQAPTILAGESTFTGPDYLAAVEALSSEGHLQPVHELPALHRALYRVHDCLAIRIALKEQDGKG